MQVQDLYSGVSLVNLITAQRATSTVTGTGVDVTDYDGQAVVILSCSAAAAGTNPTITVKLQEDDAVNGSYSDISGAAFTAVTDAASQQKMALKIAPRKKYVRAVGTIGGTNTPTFDFAVVMVATKPQL